MTRVMIQTANQRRITTKLKFQLNVDLLRIADLLTGDSMDAPDVFIAQWDAKNLEVIGFNFREE
jgi:hypothetical protein